MLNILIASYVVLSDLKLAFLPPQLPEDRTTTLDSNTLVMSEPTSAIPNTEHSGYHYSLLIK